VAHNAIAIPAGSIIPFAGPAENIPAGWMLCDGSAVNRSTYANLYNAIGVAWGTGDGSTTFNLPDLRGMFLRGVAGTDTIGDPDAGTRLANAQGGNSGNLVGSYQADAIRNITGHFKSCDKGNPDYSGSVYLISRWNHERKGGNSDSEGTLLGFDASRVVPVGSDNRPKNVAVTYIIKY
jgi:phage-related tail fiber protein